jgi:hypothetical protein
MDQLGRFMIERNECRFPAIGIWLKYDKIDDIVIYIKIYEFLKKKISKIFNKYILIIN